MQKQKNTRLLLVLGGLITLLSLIPFLKDSKGISIDKKQFTLDSQTIITDVILSSPKTKNTLSYMQGVWQINSRYELDPNMRDVFFSVLSQIELRKSIPESQKDSLIALIKNKGTEVTILNNADLIKHYRIWGNSNLQISYVLDNEDNGYVVHIPGYRSYVAGIFQVPESDWRSRRAFSALFTNLNSLKIAYPNEEIEFRYKDSFFEIVDMVADSTQLITSLENLLFLQTDQYLVATEYAKYKTDSLTQYAPMAIVSATQLAGKMEDVQIFNTQKDRLYYLGKMSDSSFCLFNKKRLKKILVKKSDFD